MEAGAHVLAQGAGQGLGQRGSLRDVDHQVIISIQGIIPAACIAEHLPRDCTQDRRGGHLSGRQWGQGCPHPSPRTPAGEGQRPSHRAVRGSHRHLQQGEGGKKHREGLSGRNGTSRRLALPLKAVLGGGEGAKARLKGIGHSQASHTGIRGLPHHSHFSLKPAGACGKGVSDGGSDEGGWGLQETRRERLGPVSPGRHLGSPSDGTAASQPGPACLPACL